MDRRQRNGLCYGVCKDTFLLILRPVQKETQHVSLVNDTSAQDPRQRKLGMVCACCPPLVTSWAILGSPVVILTQPAFDRNQAKAKLLVKALLVDLMSGSKSEGKGGCVGGKKGSGNVVSVPLTLSNLCMKLELFSA